MGFCRCLLNFTVVIILTVFIGSIWLAHKSYEFRVKEVDDLGKKWSDSMKLGEIPEFKGDGEVPLTEEDIEPIAISTGGLLGSVHLLYASVSEFFIIYHAPFETSGDTGRHFMNMSITVLQGQVDVWDERSSRMIEHTQGTRYRHRIGERGIVKLHKDTYLLVYGRGLLPLTMGYWISDSLFSSLDPTSAILTVVCYVKAVSSSLDVSSFFIWLYEYSWNLATSGLSTIPIMWNGAVGWISEKAGNIFQGGGSIMND